MSFADEMKTLSASQAAQETKKYWDSLRVRVRALAARGETKLVIHRDKPLSSGILETIAENGFGLVTGGTVTADEGSTVSYTITW